MDFRLKRLAFLLRRKLELEYDMSVTVQADKLGDECALYIRVHCMAAVEELSVDCGPDGFWQYIRRKLGLSFRSRKVGVVARALFPHLDATRDHCVFRVEAKDAAIDT